jgi:hypothetical protein
MRLSYFQFLPLSDFLHLKSANIKIVSSIFSFIYKFRFVESIIPYRKPKEHPYMPELSLFPAYAAIDPECAI